MWKGNMFRSPLKSKQTLICNVIHRHLWFQRQSWILQMRRTAREATMKSCNFITFCDVIHRRFLITESVMASEDEKDCERSDNEELTRMGKFVRFLVRIYFLPLKLGEDKTTFSFCSLPSLLNFLFYYVSSVSLSFLLFVFYFSEEKSQATMKTSGVIDILSGLSFHTTILLLFPSVPLLFGQVSFNSFCVSNQVTSLKCEQVIMKEARNSSSNKICDHLCPSGSFEGPQHNP